MLGATHAEMMAQKPLSVRSDVCPISTQRSHSVALSVCTCLTRCPFAHTLACQSDATRLRESATAKHAAAHSAPFRQFLGAIEKLAAALRAKLEAH